MIRRLSLLTGLILAIGFGWWAWQNYGPRPEAPPLADTVQHVDLILIEKSAKRLTASRDGIAVLQMQVSLGFAPLGDKQHEGDGKTPEGLFSINRRNPHSSFHLSLGLDYPRPEDITRAKTEGVDPGRDIFIHGQPNSLGDMVTLPGDWTDGCIAVSNEQMERLWALVPIGTTVEIRP